MGNLNELVLEIEARQTAISKANAAGWSLEAMQERDAAFKAIMNDLERQHAARFSIALGTHQLTLAGIRVSCTSGIPGLLSAWCRKAKRELQQQTEGA